MSLMPKISDEGNEVETFTARLAEVEGCSASASASSACMIISGLVIGGLLGELHLELRPSRLAVRAALG